MVAYPFFFAPYVALWYLSNMRVREKTDENISGLYNKIANKYDKRYKRPIHFVEEEIISEFLPELRSDQTVLDIGCGTGNMINVGQYTNQQYTGIDISEKMLDTAIQKYQGYNFIHGDGQQCVKVGGFDCVLHIFGQLNYMGIHEWLDSIIKNLRVKGTFVTVCYAPSSRAEYIDFALPPVDLFEVETVLDTEGFHWNMWGLTFPTIGHDRLSYKQLYEIQHTLTHSASLADCQYYIIVGEYCDDKPSLYVVE